MLSQIQSESTWTTINPTNGEILAHYTYSSDGEIENHLVDLEIEWNKFKKWPLFERIEGIRNLGSLLRKNKSALALLMAQEMGKPIKQGLAEIEKCASTCDYFAENGEKLVSSEEVIAHYRQTWLLKKPLGIILAVMPWNFPFWQVIRCAVPAWLSGNAIVLKHAPSVQGCARWIQQLTQEAFGALPLLQIPMSFEQTERAIWDRRIKALSFTGSTQAGRRLAAIAGGHLKKSVLELGGSDPYLVLEDADLELAAELCVRARFVNSGQSCVAGKRFFIHQSIYAPFREKVIQQIRKFRVGDPTDANTDIGPLAEKRFQEAIQNQLNQSAVRGAQIYNFDLVSSKLLHGPGCFIDPAIIENVTLEMPIINEECFGPIMPLIPISSFEQGIEWANKSEFGLGAAVFTSRPEKIWEKATEDLEVGMLAFNDMIQSDPRVPFGGVKASGWGRELGAQGLYEFINLKTVGIGKG